MSSAKVLETFESFLWFATSMTVSIIFHASRNDAAVDLRYISNEISLAYSRRVVIYSPTYKIDDLIRMEKQV